jgi:hypothetical protein
MRGLLLRAYPAALRAEYGSEMLVLLEDLGSRREFRGVLGGVRLGLFLMSDVVRTRARQHVSALRSGVASPPRGRASAPPYFEAVIAGLAVLALYVVTLAPTVAFWDSGEYLTAAHVLGIPHPPGNPLFVMTAHVWERALLWLGIDAAVALNLYSAVLSAAAHAFWYLLAWRALRAMTTDVRVQRVGAAAAVLLSATTFTVWNQSNVNEKVYTLSLFTVALCSWLMVRWRDDGRRMRYLVATFFLLVLTSTNHLMGLLAAPGLLAFVLLTDARAVRQRRLLLACALATVLGLLPQFFLPLRAAQRPVLAETEPTCESVASAVASVYTWGRTGCPALSSTLRREQYDKPGIRLDPTVYPERLEPRSPALVASQFVNYLQYFDWQWARSIGGSDTVFGSARPLVTALFLLLGVLGAAGHWRHDRAGAALLGVMFLTFSVGLVVYLNFRYGYSLERGRFPAAEFHEVRERDYFFLVSFSLWGVWCGLGVAELWRRLQAFSATRVRRVALVTAPVCLLALVPLGANWQWASRAGDFAARDWAYNVLMSVEPYGVLLTNGDNDTFPLWYLQEVEGLRRDVTVLVISYLNTSWYARQARDLTRPCLLGGSAADAPTRVVCQRPFELGQVPLELAALMGAPRSPEDTILPLSNRDIEQVASAAFVTPEPLTFRAGNVQSVIAAGTPILPADTFVAAILQASLGRRAIHFSTPSPIIEKLGLQAYAVRQGLTFRLNDGAVAPAEQARLVPLPVSDLSSVSGAYVDLSYTDTLLRVGLKRGRSTEPETPFVDKAVANIVLQYAWAHYTLAQAHSVLRNPAEFAGHVQAAREWESVIAN